MLNLQPKYLAIIQKILKEFAPHAHVLAYGSRIKDQSHEGSDLDLAIIYDKRHPQEEKHFFQLRTAIQESRLPIFVDVHKWENLPKLFQEEIEKAHLVIQ